VSHAPTCIDIEERFVAQDRQALLADPPFRDHLAACAECAAVFDALEEVDSMLPQMPIIDAPHVDLTPASFADTEPEVPDDGTNVDYAADWYAAIGDQQIGPLSHADLAAHWDAGELDADSLVWHPSLEDWRPLADVAQLAEWIIERPQHGAVGTNGHDLGPASFGGDDVEAPMEAVTWRPTGASRLADLVADEMRPPQEEKAPAPSAPAGLPLDLFGERPVWEREAAPEPAPLLAPSEPWRIPVPPPPRKRRTWVWAVLASTAATSAMAAVAVVVVVRSGALDGRSGPVLTPAGAPQQPDASTPDPSDHIGIAATPAPSAAGASEQHADAAAATPLAATVRPATAAAAPPAPAPRPKREEPSSTKASAHATHGGGGKTKGGGTVRVEAAKQTLDDVFDEDPAPTGPVKPKLKVQDIVSGVKKNAGSVMHCLKKAREAGEIIPGTYKIILDWDITPHGSVRNGRVTGPSSLMGTHIPGCFERAMRRWKFPHSETGAPVKNFPFGPFTVK